MATLYITSNANTGTGTLRQLLSDAASKDVIQPDPTIFPAGTVCSIQLGSSLICSNVVSIQGAQTRIEIKGNGSNAYSFTLGSSTSPSVISYDALSLSNIDFINLKKSSYGPVHLRHMALVVERCRVVGCEGLTSAAFYCQLDTSIPTNYKFYDCAVYGNKATEPSAQVATAFYFSTKKSSNAMWRCTYGGNVSTTSGTSGAFKNTPSDVGDYVAGTASWRTPPSASYAYSTWTKDSWQDMDPRPATSATNKTGATSSSSSITDIAGNPRKTNGAKGAWEFAPYEQLATPTNFAASNIGATSLTLSWSAVTNASSYKITYGANEVTATGTSAQITGLTSGTAYTFQIVALDEWYLDSSSASTTATTTTAIKLASPSILNHSCGANGLTLTFADESGNAAGFRIDVLVGGVVVATTTINDGNATTGTVQYAGFTYGSTYTVYLTALAEVDSRYEDSDPAFANITWTYQTQQLDPFTSSTLKVQDKDDSGVTSAAYLTATSVRIVYYNNDADFSSVNFKWRVAGGTYGTEHNTTSTYADVTCGTYTSGYWSGWGWIELTGLDPSTAYEFVAQALSSNSECLPSVYSDELEFTTAAPTQLATPSINGYPRASGDTKFTTLQIRLAGTIANATTYEYQIATNSTFTEGLLTRTSSTVSSGYPLSGYFTGLVEGTRYYCRARAKTSNAAFSDSNWSTVGYTNVSAHLASPTNLAASNITNNSATVSWGAVSNASGYKVEYRASGASTWSSQTVNS